MSANVDGMLRAGIDALKAGKKAEARALLEKVLEHDSYNEQAWLWMSAVVETREEQQTCLENVIVINPDNQKAKEGLRNLGIVVDEPEVDPFDQMTSPFTDTSFAETGDLFGAEDFDPNATSDPFASPTSSASASYSDHEQAAPDYDAWVGNLNIGNNNSALDHNPNQFGYDDTSEYESSFDADPFNPANAGYATTEAVDDFNSAINDDADYSTQFSSYDDQYAELDDYQDIEEDAPDPIELLELIPANIKLARLPGTDAETPVIFKLIVGLLVFLNIGAGAFLASQFIM